MRDVMMRTVSSAALTGGVVVLLTASCAAQTQEVKSAAPKPAPEGAKMDMSQPLPSMAAPPNTPAVPLPEPPSQAAATTALPNRAERAGWPSPTADNETYGYLLFDNLEYQGGKGPGALRWDVLGWRGGDVHRFWFKSEGRQFNASRQGTEYEVQALYGKLIAPFFDVQTGLRIDQRVERDGKPSRVYGVLGLQGLVPYRFDIEPTLFLSQTGKLSGRFTGTYDILFSQRLILQPRLEANVAAQKDEEIGVGAGLNDAELGFRLRYEIRREFAPYLGVTWLKSFGATRQLTLLEGGDPNRFSVVVGVRAWF
jgi:copper resistance protein B